MFDTNSKRGNEFLSEREGASTPADDDEAGVRYLAPWFSAKRCSSRGSYGNMVRLIEKSISGWLDPNRWVSRVETCSFWMDDRKEKKKTKKDKKTLGLVHTEIQIKKVVE